MTNNHLTIDSLLEQNATMKYAGIAALSMQKFIEDNTSQNMFHAMHDFAIIDWVEPELDPEINPICNAFLNILFEMGKSLGFKTMDELTELEIKFLELL